jgi:GDP-L-fucose synthase
MHDLTLINQKKVFITGASGLLGSAFVRYCELHNIDHIACTRADCDLLDPIATSQLLLHHRPTIVIHCAALVGGIKANAEAPYDFFAYNSMMLLNITRAVITADVEELVLPNSNCSYPSSAPQPYRESDYLAGPPYDGNLGYGAAKVSTYYAGKSLERQYSIKTYHPMPCSLYGPNDNFSPSCSHFVPAAIHRLYQAKKNRDDCVCFWGSGLPRREFMHVDDAVSGIMCMIENQISGQIVNIGTGSDAPISEVVKLIEAKLDYSGKIVWDSTKPDGAMSKILSTDILKEFHWIPSISLSTGLSSTIAWYLKNQDQIRI